MSKDTQKIVHVDYEEKMSLDQAISFLETIVTKLKEDKSFTLTHAGQAHKIEPASTVELEVKVEEQNNKHKFEFELEWKEGEQSGGMEIS